MLTVITPATTTTLTTPDAVKAELGANGGGDDGWLVSAIARASAAACSFCRRTFALETVREVFHLPGPAEVLALERWPLVSVVSVTVAGAALELPMVEGDNDTGLLYRLTASGGNRRHWTPGRIEVGYRAGYVLPGEDGRTLPEDIEHATIRLVLEQWHARGRDPLLKAQSVEGVGREEYWVGGADKLPSDVVALLTPHRQSLMG